MANPTLITTLSQITPSPAVPALTDQLVGVRSGAIDALFNLSQVAKTVSAASLPFIYIPPGTLPTTTYSTPAWYVFGTGTYTVTGTQLFQNVRGIVVQGAGVGTIVGQGTSFLWAGNATDPMFKLDGVQYAVFQDFSIFSNQFVPLAVGFFSGVPSLGGTSTQNRFHRIYMDGTAGGLNYGFRVGVGHPGNDDEHIFLSCSLNNYSNYGISIEGAQSKLHTIINCAFNSNGFGQAAVSTANGNGGSFRCISASGGGHTVADFSLGPPDDYIVISGGDWENSNRFVYAPGTSANGWPITIQNNRWAATSLNADGKAVIYNSRGPLSVIGNIFDVVGVPLQLYLGPNGPCSATAIGNQIATTLSNPFTQNVAALDPGWQCFGNVIEDNTGVSTPMSDVPGSYVFSMLPSSPAVGATAHITDGAAGNCADGSCTSFGTNVTGGGGALDLAIRWNGTNWTLIGK